MKRSTKAFAFVAVLAALAGPTRPAFAGPYPGAVKDHGHTGPGDGGRLNNLTIYNNLNVAHDLTVQNAMTISSGTTLSTTTIAGPATLSTTTISGPTTINNTVSATSSATFTGQVSFSTVMFRGGDGGQVNSIQTMSAGKFTGSTVRHLATSANAGTVTHVRFDYIRIVSTDGASVWISSSVTNVPNSLNGDITTSGAGGLDTGTVKANSWYYLFIISSGVLTTGANTNTHYSLNYSSPTLPAGTKYVMCIGVQPTDASGLLIDSNQVGDTFMYVTPKHMVTISSASLNGSYTLYTATHCVPSQDFAWMVLFNCQVTCKYSAASTEEQYVRLRNGIYATGNYPVIDHWGYQQGGAGNPMIETGNGWQVVNETTPGVYVSALCTTTSPLLSTSEADVDVIGFRIKALSVTN